MAVKTIYEMFDIVYNDNFLDLTITGSDINGDDQTIITDADAKSYIRQKYATRLFPVILGDSASLMDAKRTWQEIYTLYLTNHLHGINKQMQALFDYNYSPIENVDRYETETTEGTESGESSNTKTNNLSNSTQYGRTETNSGTDTTTFGHVVTESGTDTIRRTGNDTLEKDGSITNAKVVSSIDSIHDNDALYIIKTMPRWVPAKLNGKTIRCKMLIPISYKTRSRGRF